jgi:hypothetical protein
MASYFQEHPVPTQDQSYVRLREETSLPRYKNNKYCHIVCTDLPDKREDKLLGASNA